MEKRDESLWEVLQSNEDEVNRWKNYVQENETAIENLNEFVKHLEVEVMVPIGRKGYMPGHLIHTNEVMVAHYQGYFSKCSAHKAKEICEHRIQMAQSQLLKLEQEADLFRNKLEKPYELGVFSNTDQCEIIEDYDEARELEWKAKHEISLRKHKLREKGERETEAKKNQNETTNVDDTFLQLEKLEIMEELDKELEKINDDSGINDTVRRLMSGNIQESKTKERIAWPSQRNKMEANEREEEQLELRNIGNKIDLHNVETKGTLNSDIFLNDDDGEVLNYFTGSEAKYNLKKQARFLGIDEQITFYKYHINVLAELIHKCKAPDKLNCLRTLKSHLENLIETCEDDITDTDSEESIELEFESLEGDTLPSRRITFADEHQTLEFHRNDAVSNMLTKCKATSEPQSKRDVIRLDESVLNTNNSSHETDKHQSIMNRVEANKKQVSENQSLQDADLVTKIIGSDTRTLQIHFKHSPHRSVDLNVASQNIIDDQYVPTSPADFYHIYMHACEQQKFKNEQALLFINAYKGESQVKAPFLQEKDREAAYQDPKLELFKPQSSSDKRGTERKNSGESILRNKDAVKKEKHIVGGDNESGSNKGDEFVAYNKVITEVIDRAPTNGPEPLPTGKFIDTNAPKKRISHFQKQRLKSNAS